jgi:hypothetical protein
MKKYVLLFFPIFISIILFAQNVEIEKFSVSNYDEKVINDPQLDYSKFNTYSVISANVLFNKESLTLEEKQLEFFLNNLIATRELKFLPINDSIKPDLMFIYSFSNDYKVKYIPPQTYSIPRYSAGKTITINSDSKTNLNTYGDLNITGNVKGSNNTTVSESGKWELAQVQRPAYTQGYYFPNFSLTIYNTKDNNKIWEGNANGTSIQKDYRLPAQYLIMALAFKIPKGSYTNSTFFTNNNNGQLGFSFVILNSDGVNFYPVISNPSKKSPAAKKGLIGGDVIISVNGNSTANKSLLQFYDMIRGNVGTKFDLVINRKGKIIRKSIEKGERPIQ